MRSRNRRGDLAMARGRDPDVLDAVRSHDETQIRKPGRQQLARRNRRVQPRRSRGVRAYARIRVAAHGACRRHGPRPDAQASRREDPSRLWTRRRARCLVRERRRYGSWPREKQLRTRGALQLREADRHGARAVAVRRHAGREPRARIAAARSRADRSRRIGVTGIHRRCVHYAARVNARHRGLSSATCRRPRHVADHVARGGSVSAQSRRRLARYPLFGRGASNDASDVERPGAPPSGDIDISFWTFIEIRCD